MQPRVQHKFWKKPEYYHIASQGSLEISHPGMKILQNLARKAKTILDLGCGEGTRLNLLAASKKQLLGLDVSEVGIRLAKKKFSKINFQIADLNDLPIADNSFDLVYSAFVLEHIDNPEKVIDEMIRVTSWGGNLVVIAPNYGAPNRSSPPFKGSRIKKLVRGFLNDIFKFNVDTNGLFWHKVKPLVNKKVYHIDDDTVVEPYLRTLLSYFRYKGLSIDIYLSCWDLELKKASVYQKIFRFLGEIKVYPFYFWGPHLVISARKIKNISHV